MLMILYIAYTLELDMHLIKYRLIRIRSYRCKSFIRSGSRFCAVLLCIIIPLHILWHKQSLNSVDQYEWMSQNRDGRKLVQPDKNTTLLGPTPADCHNKLQLLLLVPSAPDNEEMRQAIRDTWGNISPKSYTRLLFFLGLQEDGIKDSVLSEAQTHNDIVVEDFIDTYENLTLKTIFMLKWTMQYCNSVPFYLKTDDDMLVNVRRLLQELSKKFNPNVSTIVGRIQSGATPYRYKSSKWYLPVSLYEPSVLPTFASGTGYVITRKALSEIYFGALDTPLIPLEDVFLTGLVANQKIGIPLISLEGFHNSKPLFIDHPCLYHPHLTIHDLTPIQMRRTWSVLLNVKSKDCDSSLARILIYFFGIGKYDFNTNVTW